MPDVTLVTRNGVRLQFDCSENENLLNAAAKAGLFLLGMCREGACGLCKAQVADGAYEMGGHSTDALKHAGPNGVLLCRCKPKGIWSLISPTLKPLFAATIFPAAKRQ